MTASQRLERGLTLTRAFEAPPDVVFESWTNPALLDWFFNPGMPVDEPVTVDFRVGGAWRQLMVIDKTTRYMTGGVYREIVPNERLVFWWGAEGGWPDLDPDHLDRSPLCTVTLTPRGPGGTRTEMHFELQLPAHFSDETVEEWIGKMGNGWGMTIDRLVAKLRRAA
jgi:uncharacterized protein YndB with AHSA1/START domain